jgi:hypothetical protein
MMSYFSSNRDNLGIIWKPQKVLTWYIPSIDLVYTIALPKPGILVY